MKKLTLANGVWRYDESVPLGSPGGFAAVFAGLADSGAPVAIKIFHDGVGRNAERELEFAASRIGKATPHVIQIYDCGVDAASRQPAIVMERGDHNLAHHIRTHGPLTEPVACAIACEIVEGLIEVSEWVHRDLKPANVIWCDGSWHLVDFGIARIANASTAPRTMKGYLSEPYAAPEQWNCEHATHATDVYALGCIVHELMTGKTLFEGETQADFARQHRSESARITTGSPALRTLLYGMVAKPQDARPTLEVVRARLKSIANQGKGTNRSSSALSAASAAVSEQQAKREAAASHEQRVTQTRHELRVHAAGEMQRIQAALFDRIREEALPAVIGTVGNSPSLATQAVLGQGKLSMLVNNVPVDQRDAFTMSSWDVLCWNYIKCSTPDYERSATLWYVNDGSGRWQWLEASYYCWGKATKADEPCRLPPGRDADSAAAISVSTWQFAHPPRVVDNEGLEAFVERWTGYLASAARGRLIRPSTFPEE